ncbi:MAG TPA: hypothetical protein VK530_14470 [Candidatus Acidoferrum sp.]|nr:hypothetical protein [Candidatus Acidoferrum sp.]
MISSNEVRGLSRNTLASKFLNGPPARSGEPSAAFIYLLFYDVALSSQGAGDKTKRSRDDLSPWPHTQILPYPAVVFMNTGYFPSGVREATAHEVGHLMGLVRRSNGKSSGHCRDSNCLMTETFNFYRVRSLLGLRPVKQEALCERCVAELKAGATTSAATNLYFCGPVLVRSEVGYHVLSLPSRVRLIVGNVTEADCRNFLAHTHDHPSLDDRPRLDGLVKPGLVREAAQALEIIDRAKTDPYRSVRELAAKLEKAMPRSEGGAEPGQTKPTSE